jgi:TetR/AcrR family transcriptional regulator, regulator of cefoperazone and chloramphenicol sensitivity
MRKPRIDGQETRRHLLEAASEVFGMKGFRQATIAEICQRAKANPAAANYHFGSKEALYVESWRFAFQKSSEAYPFDGGVPSDAPAEDRLRGVILSIMRRIIDPESHDLDIVYKEMANPTGLISDVIRETRKSFFVGFTSIIRELLGGEATEQQVWLCLMSINAQCFGPLMHMRRYKMAPAETLPSTLDSLNEDVQTLADHVTRFSLAGISGVQNHLKKGRYSSVKELEK